MRQWDEYTALAAGYIKSMARGKVNVGFSLDPLSLLLISLTGFIFVAEWDGCLSNLLDLRNIQLFLYHEVKVAVQYSPCWYYSVLSVLSVSGGR